MLLEYVELNDRQIGPTTQFLPRQMKGFGTTERTAFRQVRLILDPLPQRAHHRAMFVGLLKAWLLIWNEVLHLKRRFS